MWRPSRRDIEREVDEEIRLHIEHRTVDFEGEGRDSSEAGREARRRFGDVERYRREMLRLKKGHVQRRKRALHWEEILQDLHFGLRQIARRPALPLMLVSLIAIGVGANTAIFSVVKTVLLEPLPFESPERLTVIWETDADGTPGPASYPNFLDWREQAESFEDIGAVSYWNFNLSGGDGPERVFGTLISEGVLELLGVEPALGRTFTPQEDQIDGPKVALISHGLWQRRYGGDPDLLGEKIIIDGDPFTVIGIMPAGFEVPSPWLIGRRSDLWLSLTAPALNRTMLPDRDMHWMVPVGRLKEGVSLEAAQTEMDAIVDRLGEQYIEVDPSEGSRVDPLGETMTGRAVQPLMMLLGGAGLLLLIICSNVAGLLMAKATARQAEIGLRAALGAGRLRLVRQLFLESVPLALLGGGVGFLLALWGLAALRSMLPTSIYRIETVSFDAWVFLFTLGVSLLTGVLFNLAPAWSAARANLVDALKTGRGVVAGGARRRYRNVLLVVQLAMTLVLANAAALMLQSYVELSRGDYGFDTERVLTLGLNIQGQEYDDQISLIAFFDEVIEHVGSLAGVRHVAATSKLPLEGGTRSTLEETGGHAFAEVDKPSPEISFVTPDYFRVMEIPLIAGRTFGSQDRRPHDSEEAPLPAIINETMAERLWPGEGALGMRFSIEPPYQWTVVGVVGDVYQWGPERTPIMEIYFPLSVMPEGMEFFTKSVRYLVVRTELDPLSLTGAIRHEVASIDSRQPISDIRTTAAIVDEALTARRFNTLLIGLFATIALVLVAAGIYGVMSFSVAQRSFELGLRIAMGATRSGVQRLVLAQALRLVATGVAVGWVGIFATMRLTESMVYGLSATDPATLVAGTLFFVALGLLGSFVPARRATRQDPMLVLRGN